MDLPRQKQREASALTVQQVGAFLKAAGGRKLSVMFPMVAEADEFRKARARGDPATTRKNAMLPTCALRLPKLKNSSEAKTCSALLVKIH